LQICIVDGPFAICHFNDSFPREDRPTIEEPCPEETMAKKDLTGKRVAILVDEGFEQVELSKPRKALDKIGAQTKVVSPQEGQVRGWNMKRWGKSVAVDVPLESADPAQFDALLLPGGVMNPDKLRINPKAVEFVKHFFETGKPVAAICHAPWTLVEADVVRERTLTSWPSLKTDIKNAGGNWVDEEVVTDMGLVTSRKPDDIRAFNKKMIEEFAQDEHKSRHGERRVA
jgi:protease I